MNTEKKDEDFSVEKALIAAIVEACYKYEGQVSVVQVLGCLQVAAETIKEDCQ